MNDLLSNVISLAILPLAASLPDSEQSAAIWWLFGLAAVAVVFNQVSAAWSRLSGRFAERQSDDPRPVSEAACKERHASADNRMATMESRIQKATEGLRLEVKQDVKGIHSRIDDILAAVHELRGAVNGRHPQ